MAFLSHRELEKIGFKSLGRDVKISERAVFYHPERICIGNHVRIDDFCVLSNHIVIHDHVHIALYACLLSGDQSIIEMHDFTGVAFRSMVFTVTDDYSGRAMTNPTIPAECRKLTEKSVVFDRHALVGAHSIVLPGVHVREGSSVGAMSLLMKSTRPWQIYFGSPARRIGERSKEMLAFESRVKDYELAHRES